MSSTDSEDTTDGSNEGNASASGENPGVRSKEFKLSLALAGWGLFRSKNPLLAKIKEFLHGILYNAALKNQIALIAQLLLEGGDFKDVKVAMLSGAQGEAILLHRIYRSLKMNAISDPGLKESLLKCVLTAFDKLEKAEVQKIAREFILRPGQDWAAAFDVSAFIDRIWYEWREKWLNTGPTWSLDNDNSAFSEKQKQQQTLAMINDPLMLEKQKQLQVLATIVEIAKPQLLEEGKGALEAAYLSAKGWMYPDFKPVNILRR